MAEKEVENLSIGRISSPRLPLNRNIKCCFWTEEMFREKSKLPEKGGLG